MRRHTPLVEIHRSIPGAKMVDFHGWEMPVQYAAGIVEEHHSVRNRIGMFDVSHMGEIAVRGADAPAFLDWVCTNEIISMKNGAVRYSPICYPNGGTVDDLLVYRYAEDSFLLVVNASNTAKDYEWLSSGNPWLSASRDVALEDQSDRWAMLALQGPAAAEIVGAAPGSHMDVVGMRPFTFSSDVRLFDCDVLISRTGYTGEDGFEIYIAPEDAKTVWKGFADGFSVMPCGLGARDTLRIEACLPLYGQELSETINPIEAGLERFVRFEERDFCGKTALIDSRDREDSRRLFGCEMIDRGFPRHGFSVCRDGSAVGTVTSGIKSPTLGTFNALFLADRRGLREGVSVEIDIRGRRKNARIVKTPFYKRKRG